MTADGRHDPRPEGALPESGGPAPKRRLFKRRARKPRAVPDRAAPPWPERLLAYLSERAHRFFNPIAFFGEVLLVALPGWGAGRPHKRFRLRDFMRVLAASGAGALPIITVVNVLVGAIIAFVGAVQLVKLGAGAFVADMISIGVAREMGAVVTAVVMAGRTGAAFAAELATMQTNEEVDALAVLGLRPVAWLVLPRVLALLLMMPLLYAYAVLTGLFGGFLVGVGTMGLSPAAYIDRGLVALKWTHLGLGFSKSLAFGVLVALAGCYCGLTAQRHAAGVGEATTRAVVAGIVGVIALDAVFAVCANALRI